MRAWAPLIPLLTIACVDLTQPPQLKPPAAQPEDAGADPALDAPVPDAPAFDEDAARDAGIEEPVDGPTMPAPDGAAADLPATPEAAPAPPSLPDAAPDRAPPAPDLGLDLRAPDDVAPDLAQDLTADLPPDRGPDLAPDLTPDLAPDLATPDAGPPALVIDDFQSTTADHNNLGSVVSWDHETCGHVGGELNCVYTGSGGYHDFIETLNNWCQFDVRAYGKLRFKLRTSLAGERVDVFAGVTPVPKCDQTQKLLGTITTTTVMTTYTFDITALRNQWFTLIELDPQSTNATQFIIDDLELVP